MGKLFLHLVVFLLAFYITNTIWNFLDDKNQYCTIETSSGRVRGKQNRTLLDGKLFYTFRGIPFAKPPIKELRFKVKLEIFHQFLLL